MKTAFTQKTKLTLFQKITYLNSMPMSDWVDQRIKIKRWEVWIFGFNENNTWSVVPAIKNTFYLIVFINKESFNVSSISICLFQKHITPSSSKRWGEQLSGLTHFAHIRRTPLKVPVDTWVGYRIQTHYDAPRDPWVEMLVTLKLAS